jgi:hypothetical protein
MKLSGTIFKSGISGMVIRYLVFTVVVLVYSSRLHAAMEEISIIRQNCSGYSNCYEALSEWEDDFGGINFGSHGSGNLVGADRIAVARIEGTWTQPDTTALNISGWTTGPGNYIKIYTTGAARHDGTAGSGYRLVISSSDTAFYSQAAYLRVEGLEIHSSSADDRAVIYLRPGTEEGVGEIHFSHNIIHGDGANTTSGFQNYDCRGTVKIWNNIVYDVASLGYNGGITSERGTSYIFNNTVVDLINGFGIRAGGTCYAKNNLVRAPGDDFYGVFYPGSDFNASADNTAPGLNSNKNSVFSFVNSANDDFHLAASDTGAANRGIDLSGDPDIDFSSDIDQESRSGAWDIGADENSAIADVTAPGILTGAPAGDLPAATTQTTIAVTTNEAATCRYSTTEGTSYDNMTNTFSSTGAMVHAQTVSGLNEEQTYSYYVRCRDLSGNISVKDYEISFTILSSDAVPPVLSVIKIINVSQYSAEITWNTNENTTAQVEYGQTGSYGKFTVMHTDRSTVHLVSLIDLLPGTVYHIRVRSKDFAGNESVSQNYSFTTPVLGSSVYYVNQKHSQASDANPGTESLPWKTIEHAAKSASPGNTIIVYPGDYRRILIDRSGTPGKVITFKGVNVPDRGLVNENELFNPASPRQIPGNSELNAVTQGFIISADYVRVENFEITDTDCDYINSRSAVRINQAQNSAVVNNFIHDNNPDPAMYNYGGIVGNTHNNRNILVKGNILYRVQGTGIGLVGQNWLVEDNDVSHTLDLNTDTGAHVGGDSDAVRFFGSGHVIRKNYLHDCLDTEQYGEPHIDCFQVFSVYPDSQFAYDILVEGNYCRNMGQMLMSSDDAEKDGIKNAVHHITFRNNVFQGSRANSVIPGGYCDYFTFENNVVADAHYSGLAVSMHSHHMTVLNNIFYNNGSGSQMSDETSQIGTVWDYNLYYPDFTNPPKEPILDQHSIFGENPGFIDPEKGNFRLQPDSPAINRGKKIYEFNYDRDFNFRPQNAKWDIGAHEYGSEDPALGPGAPSGLRIRR